MIYTLVLSTKDEIVVSQEEYNYFRENMSMNFIELQGGIINPSFVVSVLIDEEKSYKDNSRRLGLIQNADKKDIENLRLLVTSTDISNIKKVGRILDKYTTSIVK